jgi:CBS domain containing-hemolysin-like protein
MVTILLIGVLAFIALGFFAGSEMAYLSCNKLKLRHLADEEDPKGRIVMRFHQNPKRFLATVLIGTNLMHVTTAGLFTYILKEYLHVEQEWLIALGLSLTIVIFAETIPKAWFRNKADDFIYRFAFILDFVDRLFGWVSRILLALTEILISATASDVKRSPFVTREEFRYVIEESTKGGALLAHEKQMIDTILNLGSLRVEEVMVPVEKFPKVSLMERVKNIKEVARRTKTHAILVYEEIPSLIVGVIYVFDVLFEENEDETLSHYLRAPLFISQDTTAEKAIFLLQSKHASYGAVINSDREVIGVVSLENLIRL